MENVIERVCAALSNSSESKAGITALMILLFISFGVASLYMLINSPA